MKTRFNLSLAILGTVCLIGSAMAQQVKTPTPIPAGRTLGHLYVILDSNKVGHLVSKDEFYANKGVGAQGGGCPDVPIYEGQSPDITYYSSQGELNEWMDAMPLAGSATIMQHDFTAEVIAATVDITVNVYAYDALTGGAGYDIYEMVCAGAGPIWTSYTIPGVPTGEWLISVTDGGGAPLACVTGDVAIGVSFDDPLDGGADGQLLAQGAAQGLVLGKPVRDLDLYLVGADVGYKSSAGDSANAWNDLTAPACYWFGGNPLGNFIHNLRGNFGVTVSLTGDYGTLGGTWEAPDNYVTVRVVDPGSGVGYDVAARMTDSSDPSGAGHLSLPFDFTLEGATRDIYVRGFGSMMNAGVTGVTVGAASTCATTCVSMAMVAGDVNHDNTIDVFDLNPVLINFTKSGVIVP